MPVIGYFSSRSSGTEGAYPRAIRARPCRSLALSRASNVAIEYRFAEGRDERLPQIAADLVAAKCRRCWSRPMRPSAMAAKAATATIPIVFTSGVDPVQIGLVASFNRPGGNATGVSLISTELGPKRLELLRELLPKPGTIAFVVNPNIPRRRFRSREMQDAAQAVGQPLLRDRGRHRRADRQSVRDDWQSATSRDPLRRPTCFSKWSASDSSRWRRVTGYPRSIEWREFVDRRRPDELRHGSQ